MAIDHGRVRQSLKSFDFTDLFIHELGWDHPPRDVVTATVDGVTFMLRPVAHKRGMVIFTCETDAVPPHPIRQKIERQATKAAHEHLTIYVDSARTIQVWQWIRREPGRPSASRQHVFHRDQPGDSLIQKLEAMAFSLEDEEGLTVTSVARRARQAFDVDRVTRRFYDRFTNEHEAFLAFVKGIHDQGDRQWYASLMLNRLMFVYFIQKKGFLDGDLDYLRNRLQLLRERAGKDKFHSFYRHFLLRLFHEGLGNEARSSALDALLGRVPYLNGGLFEVHHLERANESIEIADAAFESLFDFFDAYSWHLDVRPLHADNEINPDVLGYIFEKYINQKEMGAYYTKDDITGYIGSSAIIPRLLEVAEAGAPDAFDRGGLLWQLVRDDPTRYIFSAVRHAVDDVLPPEIQAGVSDLRQRAEWNKVAHARYALPAETWRECVERRKRCSELRSSMSTGEVSTVEDFVALNLDLSQLAQDAIDSCESPRQLGAFYGAVRGVSVLDPTCGSGAFLFAALNILEPLYEACLERMQELVDDPGAADPAKAADLQEFVETLGRVAEHPNRRYFILKSIMLDNLFGVDIMDEAVEICKLRLFLKLASQLETIEDIEPLPDIDFNIRPGNTLVGFGSYGEIAAAVGSKLDFDDAMARIDEHSQLADIAFRRFRELQTDKVGGTAVADAKDELRARLSLLAQQLDGYLAAEFGAGTAVDAWRASHQPFHWLLGFYGIVSSGGFDVIIGNPPYVEYRTLRGAYAVRGFQTMACGDLYALVMERSVRLLKSGGRLGMITPVSILGTDGFAPLRSLLTSAAERTYTQAFAERPSKLFTGVEKRLAIWMLRRGDGANRTFASKYRRWLAEERDHLFATAAMTDISDVPAFVNTSLPKVQTELEVEILRKLRASGRPLGSFTVKGSNQIVYYTRKVRYFVQFFLKVPEMKDAAGKTVPPTELKQLVFDTSAARDIAVAALNSNLFFWFFSVYSDVRNVNRREVESFPIDLPRAEELYGGDFSRLAQELTDDFDANSEMTRINYAKYGILTIQVFRPRASKPVIDRIDLKLADLYGLTSEESEFLINHDIKYRLGVGEGDG